MKKWVIYLFMLSACSDTTNTKPGAATAENLIIITTDGLRWQDLFKGMDSAIAVNPRFNEGDSSYIFSTYWDSTESARRKRLMPFFWKTIADKGRIYGNREYGNFVNNVNPYWFSYPGYSELFTGYADTAINSNEFPPNPHVTVLEFFNQQPEYKGKVAAFAAWNAFDRILNEDRSGIPVINGFQPTGGNNPTAKEQLINAMLMDSYRPWGEAECFDVFTHFAAMEHLKTRKPKVLYISYGETDEWAHHSMYRSYLDAARQFDKWVKDIWDFVQSDPQYKGKTGLLITTDHGRGDKIKEQWTSHGKGIEDASEIWFVAMGPGISAKGEIRSSMQLYQDQFAQTMAKLLGLTYKPDHPVSPFIQTLFAE